MNHRKIERSDGRGFGQQQLPANSIGISFPNEKRICRHGPISTKHQNLFTVELSQYRKSGSTFSSSEPVAARSDCRRLGNALCLCLPVRPAKPVLERYGWLVSITVDECIQRLPKI